ncbi:MAG: ubiquinone/menaquinone biosynthesis C-methylase UbiE [Halieaceae bacterium]|jgi:ubiquinone/menaquinone biosynthesis C-methylase UbiE
MNSMLAPRGFAGITPRPSSLTDESYMDYVKSFRKMVIQDMFPLVAEAGETAYQEWKAEHKVEDDLIENINEAFGGVPVARSWQRFVRTQQEMMWRQSRATLLKVADQYLAEVEAAEDGPSSIEAEPDFVTPGWARQEIHLQPGGYTDDPLGGVVFHMATRAFYEGMNDHEELHTELAELLTPPADGKVQRVLDVGCSIGQATLPLKRRFHDAEVCGLDVAMPLLKYARKLANDADLEITFRQGLAQDSKYDAQSFDSILAYLLFHETPKDTFEGIAREMHRILRPGGTFCTFDFPNAYGQQQPVAQRFLIEYDSKNNCEPYSLDFVACDFKGILESAGFDVADGPATMNPFLQTIVATRRA